MSRRFDSSLDDPATLAALGLTPEDIALIKSGATGGGGSTTNTGDATAADVADGKIFSSAGLTNVAGTLVKYVPHVVASAAARKALTGLALDAQVKETDTGLTYKVVNAGLLSSDAGWDIVGGTTDALLAKIISVLTGPGTINLQDADEPTDLVPELMTVQIPPIDEIGLTDIGASFELRHDGGHDLTIGFSNLFPLADSAIGNDLVADQSIGIGLSDNPSPAQVAAKIAELANALVNFPMSLSTATGNEVLFSSVDFLEWPFLVQDNSAGLTLVSQSAGIRGRVGYLASQDWDIQVKINGIVRHWAP